MNSIRTKVFLASLVVVITLIALFSSLSQETTTYYFTIDEIKKDPQKFSQTTIRVMGLVERGSVKWTPKTLQLEFRISDENQNKMLVLYNGTKPDMFKEGQGVVVEGTYDAKKLFQADNLLVKHTEEYKTKPDHKNLKTKYYDSLKI